MHSLHCIGGVDDLLHIVRVFEASRQGGPLVAPRGDDQGIFVAPFRLQLIQRSLDRIERGGLVHALEIGYEGFLVPGGDVLHRVADWVDNAMLDLGVGVDALDGFGKALEAVHAGDQDILRAPIVEVSEHAEPVMRTFPVRRYFLTSCGSNQPARSRGV